MRRAYRDAGIDPATVELIEGHGLGVPAADRAELRALRSVFPPGGRGTRTLGAVSSQIGHAMPAAGMAGLIKVGAGATPQGLAADPARREAQSATLRLRAGADRLAAPLDPRRRRDAQTRGRQRLRIRRNQRPRGSRRACRFGRRDHRGAMPDWDSEAFLLAAADRPALADRVRQLRDQVDKRMPQVAQEPRLYAERRG